MARYILSGMLGQKPVRFELKPGKLRSLSDANAVYRLERKRKKRPKTVFLEVKRKRRKRTNRQVESVSGN